MKKKQKTYRGFRPGREPRPSLLQAAIVRAEVAKKWQHDVLVADIRVLEEKDGRDLVHAAGKVFYVVLGALAAIDADHDILEVRVLRGAVNALYDQAEVAEVTEARRNALRAGLNACLTLIPNLPQDAIIDAALVLRAKLSTGTVRFDAFEELLP